MATTITTTEERLRSAVALLREAGHEDEARAVEEVLDERLPTRRRRTRTPAVEGVVSIAEVAKQLKTSRADVRRQIDLGLLEEAPDPETGDLAVTRQSLADYFERQALFERIGQPIGGLELFEPESTYLWEMFAKDLREDELRVAAELEAEAREDEERAAQER